MASRRTRLTRFGPGALVAALDSLPGARPVPLPAADDEQHERAAARVAKLGLAVTVVVVAAQTAGHLVNDLLLDRRFWHLNADVDGNALTWASALATLVCASVLVALARAVPARVLRFSLLAAVLTFFALDDLAGIHEDLGSYLARVGLPDIAGIWFPVYLPLFGLTFLLLWQIRPVPGRAAFQLRLGLALLGAALVGEMLAAGALSALDRTAHAWPYTVEVALEEAAELAGWILIASGLAGGLATTATSPAAAPESVATPTPTATGT